MSRSNNKLSMLPVLAVLVMLAAAAAVILNLSSKQKEPEEDAVSAGIAYLEEREAKDPSVVTEARKAIYQAKIDAQRDQIIASLTDGTTDPFSYFKDYVLCGDSRAVGFWYRNFLDKSRVIADGGHTIRNLASELDQIAALNPSQIFLCYGLNDTSIGYWNSAEEYAAEYMQIIADLQELCPDATIVVSSILPARDPAFERSTKWYNIPEWSAAVEAACKENNILFANCDQLAEDYPNLWDPDGIHLRKEFYPYWGSALIAAILMEGA